MAKKTEERKHALLSASSAKKWLNCTPSARLEDAIPEEQSPDTFASAPQMLPCRLASL